MGSLNMDSGILTFVKNYKGTAINSVIIGATIVFEIVVNVSTFRCPCVDPNQLVNCTVNGSNHSDCQVLKLNKFYGVAYLAGPAVALFIIGILSDSTVWKTWTGCCSDDIVIKDRCHKYFSFSSIMKLMAKALISPVAWIGIGLLDGKYYACAVTPLPFDVGKDEKFKNCRDIDYEKVIPYGNVFHQNQSVSQVMGWVFVALITFVGFVTYAWFQCTFPLTYYHAKYFKIFRDKEESVVESEMKTKAEHVIEKSIQKFLSKPREKPLWDKIGSTFSFPCNSTRLTSYSNLHEWARESYSDSESHIETEPLLP